MLKEDIRRVVTSQRADLQIELPNISREKFKEIELLPGFAIIISGIRRCGKSTLLMQLIKTKQSFYYLNFEDERLLNFSISDFEKLQEVFLEEFGQSNNYFFDEIQNIDKWELFIRKILDKKKYVTITGSNASLLSKELGTKLTGRHLREELFPFSFNEFLTLERKKATINSFKEYFFNGGFPEYLQLKKSAILNELLTDVVIKDIAIRHKIKNLKSLREMAVYLISNTGKEFSYNSLKKVFNLGSVNSVISFISYFEDSYLLFTLPKFSYSMKKQLVAPKKIYSIDNGLSNINSTSFSKDLGKMLENMVFTHLKKRHADIFFFQDKGECDFVIKENLKINKAIQVCYELNEDNKKREIDGLLAAMTTFNLRNGLILTYDQEDELTLDNKKIFLKPVWKWLLE